MKFNTVLFGAAVLSLAANSEAQTVTAVLVEGDTVTGVGDVTRIDNLDVNNSGAWLIEVDTDGADTNLDGAVVDSGGGVFQEGDSLTVPGFPMAVHDTWDSVRLNNNGDTCWNHSIDNTAGSSDDTGVFWNSTLVIQESNDSAPISGLPAPNPWTGFFEVFINDSNQLLVMGSVNEPTLGTGTTDRFLVRLDLDGTGAIMSSTVVAKEDDVLPGMGMTGTVDDFDSGSNAYGFNNNGDAIFIVDVDTPVNGDKIIYTWIGGVFTPVAEEGTATFFDGTRNYDFLTRNCDINDSGDYIFQADLDGDAADDAVLIVNGNTVFKREGDTFPAIAPFALAGINAVGGSSGNMRIDNNGDVFWFGDWDDPDTSRDAGLFKNETLLVQEGVTMVGGMLVTQMTAGSDKLAVSDDGRYALIEVVLDGSLDAALLVDCQGTTNLGSLCNGDGGDQAGCTDCPCANNAMAGTIGGCVNSGGGSTRLIASGSASVSLPSGDTTDLRFTSEGAPATAFGVLLSDAAVGPLNMMNPCFGLQSGTQAADRDGLRCIAGGSGQRHGGRSHDANGETGVTNNGWGGEFAPPAGIAVQSGFAAGQTRFFQLNHREDALLVCMRGLNSSQAIQVTFEP